jgi:hypothetical protein
MTLRTLGPHPHALALVVAGLLTGACGDGSVSVEELTSNASSFVDEAVWLEAPPFQAQVSCTAASCGGALPCNHCAATYGAVGASDRPVELRPDPDRWPFEVRASGPSGTVGPAPGLSDVRPLLGCHGNDVELHCAPVLPGNIERVYGRLSSDGGSRLVFLVEDLEEVASASSQETAEGISGDVRLVPESGE